jgi:hypothetical protein
VLDEQGARNVLGSQERTQAPLNPGRFRGRAGIVAWFAAALAGTSLLIVGAGTGQLVLMAIALVAPVPFAALWGRQYTAGLIAGYAFWPVAFGSVPGWLAYQVYQGVEYTVRVIGRLRPQDKRTPLQPPKPVDQR